MSWDERAADRSPVVQRSRSRGAEHARAIVGAAERLMVGGGSGFTIQDVVREAGVSLQTFYRYFAGKDQLLLAVFEDMTVREVQRYEETITTIEDPVERLRVGLTAALENDPGTAVPGHRFITAEYWRLYQLFPAEMEETTQLFVDVTERELRASVDAGMLHSDDPATDAWLLVQAVMAIFHHRAFFRDHPVAAVSKERLWSFCLAALSNPDRRGHS